LWRGETVDEPLLSLRQASMGPIGIARPPLVVGGAGQRTMAVAARWADGWNVTGPATPAEYEPIRERMRRICEQVGWSRPLSCSIQLFARDLALSDLRGLIRDFDTAGATEILFALDRGTTPEDIYRLADAAGTA